MAVGDTFLWVADRAPRESLMQKEQTLGMIIGCAVGDAFGAPYELMAPEDITVSPMYTTGDIHGVGICEWTDDTALMIATMDAYIKYQGFNARAIADNFNGRLATGKFGTRDHVFDVGLTTKNAINNYTDDRPYAAGAGKYARGNGSIMRIAPAIAANHNNTTQAIGEAVALALLTHGNSDTVTYISAFADEIINGQQYKNHHPRMYDVKQRHNTGYIMHSYNVAWKAGHYGQGFHGSLMWTAKLGCDTDTNCAVTGTLVGARNGIDDIPKHLIDNLQQKDMLFKMAEEMYEIGASG